MDAKLISRTWKGIPDCWRAAAWHAFLTASAKRRGIGKSDTELVTIYTVGFPSFFFRSLILRRGPSVLVESFLNCLDKAPCRRSGEKSHVGLDWLLPS